MKRIPGSAGCLVVLALSALAPCGALAQGTPSLRRLQEEAEQAEARGELDQADLGWRRLTFMGSSQARRRQARLAAARAEPFLRQARELRQRQPERAAELALQAWALQPDASCARLLERLGLTRQGQAWLSDEQLAAQRAAAVDPEQRRAELQLGPEFAVIQRGPFRLFTDVDARQGRSVLEQMLCALEAHLEAWSSLMAPLGPRSASELDVVLFQREGDYQALVHAPGTAGVYVSRREASYFYAGRAGFDFGTLLHEVTHQLNDKLLGARRATPWLEEGLAEYFGAGILSQGARQIRLGVPERTRLADFRGLLCKGQAAPVCALLGRPSAELSSAYYADSWALTFFLLEGHPLGRAAVFDLLQACQQAGRPLSPAESSAVLGRYGLDGDTLDQARAAWFQGDQRLAAARVEASWQARR